jgi:hypothetical protein
LTEGSSSQTLHTHSARAHNSDSAPVYGAKRTPVKDFRPRLDLVVVRELGEDSEVLERARRYRVSGEQQPARQRRVTEEAVVEAERLAMGSPY